MNNSLPDDPLDRLLSQWGENQSPNESDLTRMSSKIIQSLDQHPNPTEQPQPLILANSDSRWPAVLPAVAWFAFGAAAVVLLAFGYDWFASSVENPSKIVKQTTLLPAFSWLQDDQLRNKALVLNELELLFDHKLNWFTDSADKVQVGIEGLSLRSDAQSISPQAIAVRVVVERRPVGRSDWTIAWAIDVVAKNEEVVCLNNDSADDPKFAMWAYLLPDGEIVVDTDLNFGDGALKSHTSEVQVNRDPREVFMCVADGFEYRAFQAAAVLEDTAG